MIGNLLKLRTVSDCNNARQWVAMVTITFVDVREQYHITWSLFVMFNQVSVILSLNKIVDVLLFFQL